MNALKKLKNNANCKMFKNILFNSLFIFTINSQAIASYCGFLEKPFKVDRPNKPFCISYDGDSSKCAEYEITYYNNAVDEYNAYLEKMKEYAKTLNCLLEEARFELEY